MKWHLQLKIKIQNQYLELIKFLNLKSILILIILIIKIANYNQKHYYVKKNKNLVKKLQKDSQNLLRTWKQINCNKRVEFINKWNLNCKKKS